MQKKYTSKFPFPNLKRACQLNDSYCGPAVLEMLLDYQGYKIDQENIVKTAGVVSKIHEYGMTVDELAMVIKMLAPEKQFWYKLNSRINDLSYLVNDCSCPVGVEWQGIFNEEGEEEGDDDPGHYSIITSVNIEKKYVLIADPYMNLEGKDRKISLETFKERWWDINEIVDPFSKKKYEIEDNRLLFIVTKKEETFPLKIGMVKL